MPSSGIIQGLDGRGTEHPYGITDDKELLVFDAKGNGLLEELLMETRAVRLGIEHQLKLPEGSLLSAAMKG